MAAAIKASLFKLAPNQQRKDRSYFSRADCPEELGSAAAQEAAAAAKRASIFTKFERGEKRGYELRQTEPEQAAVARRGRGGGVRSLGGKHLSRTEHPRSSPPSSLSRFLSSSTCAPSGKCG